MRHYDKYSKYEIYPFDTLSRGGVRRLAGCWTYITEDLSSFLGSLHVQGAKGDPWGTLSVAVVVSLVLIL